LADGLEYAGKQIKVDFRNTITHLQLVDPADIPRFKTLGVVASTQPYWHLKEPGWWAEVDLLYLGQARAEKEYPLQSFLNAGVVLTASSDCPVTPIPNPFWAIEAGVTRNLNNPGYYGVDDIINQDDPQWLLNPAERVGISDMLKAYTINGAYQLLRDKEIGSIQTGKLADLIVIDQDITKVDPVKIDSTIVLLTMLDGKVILNNLK
jgi:predicted amidohydrolase YtcJ